MEVTHPLLLCGYEGLEAGGHAEAQLVNKRRLRLAVDLHADTRLEGRVLWKEHRRKETKVRRWMCEALWCPRRQTG